MLDFGQGRAAGLESQALTRLNNGLQCNEL